MDLCVHVAIGLAILMYILMCVRYITGLSNGVVERRGRFNRIVEPGLCAIWWPFERLCSIVPAVGGTQQLRVPLHTLEARHRVKVSIEGMLLYGINSVEKAAYKTPNLHEFLSAVAHQCIRREIAQHEAVQFQYVEMTLAPRICAAINAELNGVGCVCERFIIKILSAY